MEVSHNPRRKFVLDITIGGDTWQDCIRDLSDILRECEQRKDGYGSVMGGYSVGHVVTTDVDPTMTPERYQGELSRWMEWRQSSRANVVQPQIGETWMVTEPCREHRDHAFRPWKFRCDPAIRCSRCVWSKCLDVREYGPETFQSSIPTV